MKKIIFSCLLIMNFYVVDVYAQCLCYEGLPIACPCKEVIVDSPKSAADLAQACASSDGCSVVGGYCSSFTDDEGNTMASAAICGCPPEGDPDPDYCWSSPLPPYTGGCCGSPTCYYVKIQHPQPQCKLGKGKKCACEEVGDPLSIYTGNSRQTITDLEINSPNEHGLKFYRTYHSQSTLDDAMGFGWTHNYNVLLKSVLMGSASLYRVRDEDNNYHYFQDTTGLGIYTSIQSSQSNIAAEQDGSFTWYRDDGTTYKFSQSLLLTSVVDSQGNEQTLVYDTDERLESVTDQATGRSIGFIYNADSRIEQITGPVTAAVPGGIWATYQYDPEGNLIRVEYADDNNGSVASGFKYKYEDLYDIHNLTEKRNLADEFLSSWVYDDQDRTWKNTTRDARGVEISYGTDQVTVTDEMGAQKIYSIDVINGRKTITGISGANCASCGGNAARYGYDDYGRVIEMEMANGRIDQYTEYDNQDRYTTEIQAVGTVDERTIHYTYHPETGERLSIVESSILGSGDKETIFDYDDDGNAVPNENPTRLMHRKIERGFTYDAAGTLTPYEHITLYSHNAKGQMIEIDGPLPGDQDKITYTYDPVTGDKLTETRALVGTITYGYDDAGNVTSVTAPDGTVTTIAYDGRNRQVSSTRNGITTSRTYTAAGELSSTTDALNRTLNYTYNPAGFMEKIVDPSGNFMYYGYDNLGQRTEESIFAADNTQTHYRGTDYGDPASNPDLVSGKPWKSIHRSFDDSTDLENTYAYDSSGNLKSVTDANGKITTYAYDAFNRLYQVIQPGDTVTTYGYDIHGNLSSVTDAEGHVTTYTYDDLGRLVETDSPDTGFTRYSYDESGNLRFKVQNNNTIEYQYDTLGRLTNILYSDPAQNVTMTYDSGAGANLLGRLASVSDPSGLVEYSYDNDGRLEMETRTVSGIVFVTGYSYDDAGNLRSITYPTGQTIEYQPDAADPARIGAVVLNPFGSNQTLASAIGYKPFGPAAAMTLGNGITVSWSYDKNYQLLSIGAGTVIDRSYTPDNVGNIQLITDNLDGTRSQSFIYDDLYRLTDASGVYGTVGFTYDKVGNRLTRTQIGTTSSQDSYAYYPGSNRLQTVTGDHAELMQYDADGNTTQRIPGAANPQPAITDSADYTYNSAGQRAIKDATNDVVYHYDQSGQLIAETDATGTMLKAYVWLFGQPLAMIAADGAVYYFHNDHLGTPQKMTDSSGAVVWAADYLPFGQTDVTIATVENNLRFAGQYYDNETGLHYNYHRYYDPKLGRYLRADPLTISDRVIKARSIAESLLIHDGSGLESLLVHSSLIGSRVLLDSQKQSLYSYAQNNPINFFDQDGQYAQALIIVGGGVLVTGAIISHNNQTNQTTDPTPWTPNTPDYDPNPGDKFSFCVKACQAMMNKLFKCPTPISKIPCGVICVFVAYQ